MKNTLNRIAMVCVVAALPLAATAAMQIDEAEAAVKSMLGGGASADQVIEALVEDGRSLREATATAVQAAGGEDRLDLAKAGICASSDIPQAEQVGKAAIGAVADNPDLRHLVEGTIAGFETGVCAPYAKKENAPPTSYETRFTPSGGGVSPST